MTLCILRAYDTGSRYIYPITQAYPEVKKMEAQDSVVASKQVQVSEYTESGKKSASSDFVYKHTFENIWEKVWLVWVVFCHTLDTSNLLEPYMHTLHRLYYWLVTGPEGNSEIWFWLWVPSSDGVAWCKLFDCGKYCLIWFVGREGIDRTSFPWRRWFRRCKTNHKSAIKIAAPATPPTTPPAITPVLVDEAGFGSLVLVCVEDAVVLVVVEGAIEVDDAELGVGVAISH